MILPQITVIGSIGFVKNNYVEDGTSNIFLGGTGFTIAHTLSRWSNIRIKLISAVGDDGSIFIRSLESSGIDTSTVDFFKDLPTAHGEVNTYSGGRQEWISFQDQVTKHIKPRVENQGLLTILSPIHKKVFREFQELLIEGGTPYIYDPGMLMHDLSDEALIEGVEHSRFVIANESEWLILENRLGMAIHELADLGVVPIITRGSKGVVIFEKERKIEVPSIEAPSIDPTGAGDVWRAGFAYKITNGVEVIEATKFANAIASICVEYKGAVDFTLEDKEIQRRLDLIEKPYELR